MIIPQYLKTIVSPAETESETLTLSINNKAYFEVYYSGVVDTIDDVLYITAGEDDTENVERIFIKAKDEDKMYVVYDGLIHGYDNMFCDEHDLEIERPLKQLELEGTTLFEGEVTLGYGIEYDEEKEDYDMDEDDMQQVFNRKEKVSWDLVKEEGFDWITIKFTNEAGKSVFLDIELA